MRILDRESVVFDFASLGFTDHFQQRFVDVLQTPHGILLVTGPTGSGKTTTLYTALSQINTPDVKIITVEDPVEYQLEGINQIQVKPQIGLDFSGALRSIMRQDPDVIMIGEMRDLETCRIAIQSALTGHLVLSTLHTNSRLRRHHPPARHGRGGLPARLHRQRHPGAATGAPAGSGNRDSLRALARGDRRVRTGEIHRRTPDPPVEAGRAAPPIPPATAAAARSWSSWS